MTTCQACIAGDHDLCVADTWQDDGSGHGSMTIPCACKDEGHVLSAKDRKLLREEAVGYGLPEDCSLDLLLRHIYGNRDATYAAKDLSLKILRGQIADVDNLLNVLGMGGQPRTEALAELGTEVANLRMQKEAAHHRLDMLNVPREIPESGGGTYTVAGRIEVLGEREGGRIERLRQAIRRARKYTSLALGGTTLRDVDEALEKALDADSRNG